MPQKVLKVFKYLLLIYIAASAIFYSLGLLFDYEKVLAAFPKDNIMINPEFEKSPLPKYIFIAVVTVVILTVFTIFFLVVLYEILWAVMVLTMVDFGWIVFTIYIMIKPSNIFERIVPLIGPIIGICYTILLCSETRKRLYSQLLERESQKASLYNHGRVFKRNISQLTTV